MKNTENLRRIQWKDLVALNTVEVIFELTISLPWLLLSLFCAANSWYAFALFASFMFFLTGLRQVHNGYHLSLGINARATDLFLTLMSILMLTSMHAVKYNHLEHHRHCLGDGDVEGACARMPFWKVILFGPVFPVKLHLNALKNAPPLLKAQVKTEILLIVFTWAILLALQISFLKYHFIAMCIGECGTAFFAVWTVHHHCDGEAVIGRTLRGRWKSLISYNMFYHTEHHLFPAVPTCHLPQLASRIDEVMPEVKAKTVI